MFNSVSNFFENTFTFNSTLNETKGRVKDRLTNLNTNINNLNKKVQVVNELRSTINMIVGEDVLPQINVELIESNENMVKINKINPAVSDFSSLAASVGVGIGGPTLAMLGAMAVAAEAGLSGAAVITKALAILGGGSIEAGGAGMIGGLKSLLGISVGGVIIVSAGIAAINWFTNTSKLDALTAIEANIAKTNSNIRKINADEVITSPAMYADIIVQLADIESAEERKAFIVSKFN